MHVVEYYSDACNNMHDLQKHFAKLKEARLKR